MVAQPVQVAGYRVITRLGSGGMGTVYLVENPQLRRREALKVISIAETVDWARTLVALQVGTLDDEVIAQTLGVVLKHREDIELAVQTLDLDRALA